MSKVRNYTKVRKKDNENEETPGVSNQVNYIFKLLESLPQDAKQKAFLELKNRISLDGETSITTSNENEKLPVSQSQKTSKVSKNVETNKNTMVPTRRSSRMAKKSKAREKETESFEEIILPHSPFPHTPYIDSDESNDVSVITNTQNFPEVTQCDDSHTDTSKTKESIPYSRPKKSRVIPQSTINVEEDSEEPSPPCNVPIDPKIIHGCFVMLEKIPVIETEISKKKKQTKNKSNDKDYTPPVKKRRNSNISIKRENFSEGESSSDEPKYYCEKCDKQFQSYNGYRCHMYRHEGTMPFKCQYCGKQFPLKYPYQSHIRRHEKVKPFSCVQCDYKGVNKIDLELHSTVHSDTKSFACDSCGKSFASKTRLNTHVTYVHNKDKLESLVCHVCGFLTKSKYSLNRHHLLAHTDKEKFQCPICFKVLVQKALFKSHLQSHTGVGMYSCEVCQKKCVSKARLALHMKTHRESTFNCQKCCRKYKFQSQLIAHQRVHEKRQPFQCTQCDFSTTMKANFTKHVRNTHDKEYEKPEPMTSELELKEENVDHANPQLVEKGLTVLEELMKESAAAEGREYSIEELRELELKHQEMVEKARAENRPIPGQRKRGRPPNPNKLNGLQLPPKRRQTSVQLTKDVIESLNAKYISSMKGKIGSAEAKRIADLKIDLSQFVFEVEDVEVDVPIEFEEEGKKVKMIIIELKGDDEEEEEEGDEEEDEEVIEKKEVEEVEHILADSIEIMGDSCQESEVHEVHLIPTTEPSQDAVVAEEIIDDPV